MVYLRTLAGIDDRATASDTLTPSSITRRIAAAGPDPEPGPSTVSLEQLAEAQRIAPVACVQNIYNIANRADAAR